MPASIAACMTRIPSARSRLPHVPNIMVPRQCVLTLTPVVPSVRYSISAPFDATGNAPFLPGAPAAHDDPGHAQRSLRAAHAAEPPATKDRRDRARAIGAHLDQQPTA